jgi:hypothetical protein
VFVPRLFSLFGAMIEGLEEALICKTLELSAARLEILVPRIMQIPGTVIANCAEVKMAESFQAGLNP